MTNQNILITGATGTVGQIVLKHILHTCPQNRVIVFSRDEYKQYLMAREICDDRVKYYIGDITDYSSFLAISEPIDIIIHCAAMKHVTICENNPEMAIKVNIHGSMNVINYALHKKCSKVLFISTDKANTPNNTYGLTKSLADKLCINANKRSDTIFSVVRFGNIFGSRGSVVETYKNIIKNTTSPVLPITHLDIGRYFVFPKELGSKISEILELMSGGEIFVPIMKCMRIRDIGKALDKHVNFDVIGLQPGERFAELLVPQDEKFIYTKGSFIIVLPEANSKLQKYTLDTPSYYDFKEIQDIINEI